MPWCFRQFAMPGEEGVRLHNRSHFLQRLFAKLHPELRKDLTLSIGQSDASLELVAQQTIFGHQVRVTQQ